MTTEQINQYLTSLGMAGPFQGRVRDLIARFATFDDSPLRDMFVSDYVEQSGLRRYTNTVLFSQDTIFEAEGLFEGPPKIWMASAHQRFSYVKMTYEDYDFVQAGPGSRLSCFCVWSEKRSHLDLKASGDNCDRLKRIVREYRAP